MKKIWIDVSDLMSWSGHMTGIQRVSYNLAFRLNRDNDNVYTFYYDEESREFYEVDFNFNEWAKRSEETQDNPISQKDRLRSIVPYRVQNLFSPKTKQRILGVMIRTKSVLSRAKRKLKPVKMSIKTDRYAAQFTESDSVYIFGNGWDRATLMQDAAKKKEVEGFKLVNVVYDLIPVFEPQYFGGLLTKQYAEYTFESLSACDLLLAISENTKNDIYRFCERFDMPKPKVSVFRLGDELESQEFEKPGIVKDTQKFIICVGTIEVRKNHSLLYYAYKSLISKGLEPPLLFIIGKKGWYTDDVTMLIEQDPEVNRYIKIVSGLKDSELNWLYANCSFTVYPALYEGWGLPVAESLAYGKPVICSDVSSVPEVGGEYAIYSSPYDAKQFGNGVYELFNDQKLLNKKSDTIRKGYTVTTWEDCYKQVKDVLKKL